MAGILLMQKAAPGTRGVGGWGWGWMWGCASLLLLCRRTFSPIFVCREDVIDPILVECSSFSTSTRSCCWLNDFVCSITSSPFSLSLEVLAFTVTTVTTTLKESCLAAPGPVVSPGLACAEVALASVCLFCTTGIGSRAVVI